MPIELVTEKITAGEYEDFNNLMKGLTAIRSDYSEITLRFYQRVAYLEGKQT